MRFVRVFIFILFFFLSICTYFGFRKWLSDNVDSVIHQFVPFNYRICIYFDLFWEILKICNISNGNNAYTKPFVNESNKYVYNVKQWKLMKWFIEWQIIRGFVCICCCCFFFVPESHEAKTQISWYGKILYCFSVFRNLKSILKSWSNDIKKKKENVQLSNWIIVRQFFKIIIASIFKFMPIDW